MPIEYVTTNRRKLDDVKGLPFVRIPGNPPEHKVYGEFNGIKVRAGGVEMVWNDMLLMDALEGHGHYAKTVREDEKTGGINYQVLLVAERVYGVSPAHAVEEWLQMPKVAPRAGHGVQAVPMMRNEQGDDPAPKAQAVADVVRKVVAVVMGTDGYDRAQLECGHQGKIKSDAKVKIGMGVYCVECAATGPVTVQ